MARNGTLMAGAVVLLALLGAAAFLDAVVVPGVLVQAADPDANAGLAAQLVRAHALENPGNRTLELYQAMWARGLRGFAVLWALLGLGVLAASFPTRARRSVRDFFHEPGSPFDLALFRIVLFATVWSAVDADVIALYSEFPEALEFPLGGLGGWVAALPRSEALARAGCALLAVFCFSGAIGLFTRTSAVAVALLAFYLLGIPQLFGKVNHYHHMVWFPAILAFSPAGHALAVDGIRRARRLADAGQVGRPERAPAYSAPLRVVLLLLGLIYFFPGFWKWVQGGSDWIFSDHMRFLLYRIWSGHEDPSIFPRLDRVPLALSGMAIATLVFEMGAIFGIFFRRTRPLVGATALVFHHLTATTLGIRFFVLSRLWIVYFDWGRILEAVGRRLFPEPLELRYDAQSPTLRRTLAAMASFDVLGRVAYESAPAGGSLEARIGLKQWHGAAAWRALLRRLPLLWPALPLLSLPAIQRALTGEAEPEHHTPAPALPMPRPSLALAGVAALLLAVNLVYGAAGATKAWPFACYPKFSGLVLRPETSTIAIEAWDEAGAALPLNRQLFERRLERARFKNLAIRIVTTENPALRDARLEAFWTVLARVDPSLQHAETVRFYRDRLSTVPEERAGNPLQRSLLLEREPRSARPV